ncbi:MAG: alanine--glyoxylate aminotransferase family protein [Armatimonadota bacterium]|nr:MAG: alanine--glyoxylate aminotransferase family protein [Armatimonadota bacterium]
MIPGPTPVAPSVLRACSKPMINHRGPEFTQLQNRCNEGLQRAFKTTADVLTLTCSGTGALEAAVVSTLSPGDKVLSLSIGSFGDRFAEIAEAFGADVERMPSEWGAAVDADLVAARLKKDSARGIKAVLVTHNETSTGVTNDVAAVAAVVRDHGALLLVDAVSSLVAIDLRTDEWGIDVVAAASQKAFMVPPGLAFVSMNDRAWAANAQAKMHRYYLDLKKAKEFMDKGQTPWTPALPQMYGLDEGLRMIEQEGLENCFARHRRLGAAVRAACDVMGLKLLADRRYASNAVTAIVAPDGIGPAKVRSLLLDKYGVVLAGGQGKLKETVFRIGHLGYVNETDIMTTLAALGAGLHELGVKVDIGAALDAAHKELTGR